MWLSEIKEDDDQVAYLSSLGFPISSIHISKRELPKNMPEGYVLVDVLGPVVKDIFNSGNTKPIYIWFESIFAIPEELAGGLMLVNKDYDYGSVTTGP